MADTPRFKDASHIHFTGIKGVGMTAAALCARDLNIPVSGSDIEDVFVTQDVLNEKHININIGFTADNLHPDTDLLVYTGAHKGPNNPQVIAAKERGIRSIPHAQAVAELMLDKVGISICGVGGKTSTSSMIATILDYAGTQPSYLIGVGKILNLQVSGKYAQGDYFVAEADEYAVSPGVDNSPRFMRQTPKYIICTNIAYDHPDVYHSIEETKNAYLAFFNKVPKDGMLILNGDDAHIRSMDLSHLPTLYFGQSNQNQWWVANNTIQDQKNLVTFKSGTDTVQLTLIVPGKFNATNALAAYIVSQLVGIDSQDSVQALQLFRGSMRRFEKVGEYHGALLFDDYAHHPKQIQATLKAAQHWLPMHRLIVLFQPHTYTRTKLLFKEFVNSFADADKVIITDVYPSSREVVDPTVSGEKLAKAIQKDHPQCQYIPRSKLVEILQRDLKHNDALISMGAGDVYQVQHILANT